VRDLGACSVYKITGSLLQELVVDPKLDEKKIIHRVEGAKEYACQ
jgi:hypothetical protein